MGVLVQMFSNVNTGINDMSNGISVKLMIVITGVSPGTVHICKNRFDSTDVMRTADTHVKQFIYNSESL